jgi:SAM-dependent methyltransferase
LNFGEYLVAPLQPPIDLAAESFDLIIGISVFSHLRERDQREWLGELFRLAKPEGILLLSTLGEMAAARSSLPAAIWRQWQATGFLRSQDTSGVGAFIGDQDYYVAAFLTEAYIRQHWSPPFQIVDFIPSYISNHQDLVVLRKPL